MTARNSTGAAILRALEGVKEMREHDIAIAIGNSWLGVSAAMRALCRDGKVSRIKGRPGYYRLSRSGVSGGAA